MSHQILQQIISILLQKKSHDYLKKKSEWTTDRQMKLNTKKTNYMIFNFSKNYNFNTRLTIEGTKLDQVKETKLLGLVLRDDLSWKSNSAELTKRAYSRMLILKNLVKFDVPLVDLVQIYILYIRSVMEQSAVVWHPTITKGE